MHTISLVATTFVIPALWGGIVAWTMTRLWPQNRETATDPSSPRTDRPQTVDYQI